MTYLNQAVLEIPHRTDGGFLKLYGSESERDRTVDKVLLTYV